MLQYGERVITEISILLVLFRPYTMHVIEFGSFTVHMHPVMEAKEHMHIYFSIYSGL